MEKLIYYDQENDILSIHKGFSSDEKFKGNIDAGQLVLDVSTKKRIRGIEIMNASSFFKEFNINKKKLENITDATMRISITPNGIFVGLSLKVKNTKQAIPATIAVPLDMPQKIDNREKEITRDLKDLVV
jgi:uncharacterized protein YuzE